MSSTSRKDGHKFTWKTSGVIIGSLTEEIMQGFRWKEMIKAIKVGMQC